MSSVRPSAAILSTNPSHCYKVSRPWWGWVCGAQSGNCISMMWYILNYVHWLKEKVQIHHFKYFYHLICFINLNRKNRFRSSTSVFNHAECLSLKFTCLFATKTIRQCHGTSKSRYELLWSKALHGWNYDTKADIPPIVWCVTTGQGCYEKLIVLRDNCDGPRDRWTSVMCHLNCNHSPPSTFIASPKLPLTITQQFISKSLWNSHSLWLVKRIHDNCHLFLLTDLSFYGWRFNKPKGLKVAKEVQKADRHDGC